MKILLLYSGHDGQTRKIANYIAAQLQGQLQNSQLQCEVRDLHHEQSGDFKDYQAIVIGAAIRYGHFNRKVTRFIHHHLPALQQRPSAFFAVNLTARKMEKRTVETNAYTRKFLQKSPWKPALSAVFAGALRYPQYRWFDRVMIQLIMRMTGGETDSSKEIEYTDWQQVNDFTKNFIYLLDSE